MDQKKPHTDWLGMFLAAFVVLACALPQAVLLPALDRDESRFAQASRQMVETGDLLDIRFQEAPRYKKPAGIYWLQTASATVTGAVDQIWSYRLPSLLGAMLAAAAVVWGLGGAMPMLTARLGGILYASSLTLGIEAAIAKTDALLTGLTTVALMVVLKLFLEGQKPQAANETHPRPLAWLSVVFWMALGLAVLVKGPVAPLLAGLMILVLGMVRRWGWARPLLNLWGIGLFGLLVVPWAVAITHITDGMFWQLSVGGDLAPKLAGGHERHGGPFGLHTALLPFGLWPASVLLPAAVYAGWVYRRQPVVMALLAMSLPGLLVFELMPTKLAHYALPTYAGVVGLGLMGAMPLGRWRRVLGALVVMLGAVALAAVMIVVPQLYSGDPMAGWLFAGFVLVGGAWGAWAVFRNGFAGSVMMLTAAGFVAHLSLTVVAVGAQDLWVAKRVKEALVMSGWQGETVASSGFSEPSLVFGLGTETQLVETPGEVCGAPYGVLDAKALPILEGLCPWRPVLTTIWGYNYSKGDPVVLAIIGPEDKQPETDHAQD